MIIDNETNFLYLADSLRTIKDYNSFSEGFEKILKEHNINYAFLDGTKDIWCRDYMPIQIESADFVQFKYSPDYLRDDRLWKETIPNTKDYQTIYGSIKEVNCQPKNSSLLIDGGNIIKAKDKVILCDKIFFENKGEKRIIKEIEKQFPGHQIIFIPWDKSDFTGHADGMVRFLDDKHVLINKYGACDEDFQSYLLTALHNSGLVIEDEIPYNPYANDNEVMANGVYINYLEIGSKIFIPTFNQKEDELAFKKLNKYYKEIIPVDSRKISIDGGILNCISWNIKVAKNIEQDLEDLPWEGGNWYNQI